MFSTIDAFISVYVQIYNLARNNMNPITKVPDFMMALINRHLCKMGDDILEDKSKPVVIEKCSKAETGFFNVPVYVAIADNISTPITDTFFVSLKKDLVEDNFVSTLGVVIPKKLFDEVIDIDYLIDMLIKIYSQILCIGINKKYLDGAGMQLCILNLVFVYLSLQAWFSEEKCREVLADFILNRYNQDHYPILPSLDPIVVQIMKSIGGSLDSIRKSICNGEFFLQYYDN